jgi:hypothetical protein
VVDGCLVVGFGLDGDDSTVPILSPGEIGGGRVHIASTGEGGAWGKTRSCGGADSCVGAQVGRIGRQGAATLRVKMEIRGRGAWGRAEGTVICGRP